MILVYLSLTIIRRGFNIITQVIIEIPKQSIDRKVLNFVIVTRQRTTTNPKSHRGQNGKCFPRILKHSASKKKPKRRLKLSQSRW